MAEAVQGVTDEALIHRILQVERDLVGARFKHSRGQLENTATLRVLRRDIARLRTEARRRESEGELAKDSLLHRYRGTFQAGAAPSADESAEKGGFLSGIVDRLTGNE